MLNRTQLSLTPRGRRAGALAAIGIGALLLSADDAGAQTAAPPDRTAALKRMSLGELFDLEVTTVSKRPEKLTETASAIQVITAEDIRRSGATSLTEALRLVSNLRVAQINGYAWVVSARGFSGSFTNKLLVMIDGRTVYTPLFAGVLWDVQQVVLEDIERIEVVSGPGGTLWGANAVNGVINVITKGAKDTQGVYVSGSGGSLLQHSSTARYGGAVGANLLFRVYGQRSDRQGTFSDGKASASAWDITQAGFRLDWQPSAANTVTLQGDLYGGTEQTTPLESSLNGQNVLGRWTRTLSQDSDVTVQLYVDRTWRRDVPSTITDELITSDVDVQHRFPLGGRHSIVWGGGYRRMQDDTPTSTTFVGFLPQRRTMNLFSGFAQDEVTLVPARLKLTVGSKLERNSFSGIEVQPSARLAWTPREQHTIWSAVSRAVRSPSRIDVDYHIPAVAITIGTLGVNGGPTFRSETVVAYELGYRVQPTATSSVSLATFYNAYDHLYSVESVRGTPTYQIENGTRGQSWGVELSDTYQPVAWWRLRGGYTYFHKDLWEKPGHRFDSSSLGNDPAHQVVLQSIFDLPAHTQLDLVTRYSDALPAPRQPGYASVDLRIAWQVRHWELAVVGQNLTDDRHAEFGTQEIPRSVYGKMTARF
jgi:iron complex outermembrane receptor protein